MKLNWNGDGKSGKITAYGGRGVYTIETLGKPSGDALSYLLTAVGHDTLPLLEIPYEGNRFDHLGDALTFANHLDRSRTAEAEVSGC